VFERTGSFLAVTEALAEEFEEDVLVGVGRA
jgi:hypothetical protein